MIYILHAFDTIYSHGPNIHMTSEEELAGLEKIGKSSIQRIVELRARALTGEHEALTVMDLAKIRLPADYWQGLIDAGILSIQMPPTAKHKPVSEQSDALKEVIQGLNRLERRIGRDGDAVRIQLNSISNCLSNYGPRLEMVETNAKDHHPRICSFEETLASLSERWGVASSFAEFPLSSLDGSSDPSSGNHEPMTRVRDRQESADMMGRGCYAVCSV